MKEKYFIVSEDEQGKNPYVISTDSSTPDFEIAGPFNSIFAAQNKLKKLTKNKKQWGGTAESSETGAFIGGENASSMYNTGGGVDKDKKLNYLYYSLKIRDIGNENKFRDLAYKKGFTVKQVNDYLATKDKHAKGGPLKGNQNKLDLNKNGKLDAEDFKMLRSKKMNTGGGVREKEIYDYYSEQMDGAPNIMYAEIERDIVKKYKLGSVQNLHKILEKFPMKEMVKGGGVEGDVVTYNNKKYKKLSNGKWQEIGSDGLTHKEHELKAREHGNALSSSKTKNLKFHFEEEKKHIIAMNKLDGKQYTDEQIGLNKDKKENGGAMNETFPENDAMSYAKGGGVSEYKIKENGKTITLFSIEKIKGDQMTAYKGIDKDGKEHYFAIEQYIEGSTKYSNGGSTKGFEYSIGGL